MGEVVFGARHLEDKIVKVILGGKKHPWLEDAVELLAPKEYAMIKEGVCPFCKRRYRRIELHYASPRNPCHVKLYALVKYIKECLLKATYMIRYERGKYMVRDGKDYPKFTSFKDALALALKLVNQG